MHGGSSGPGAVEVDAGKADPGPHQNHGGGEGEIFVAGVAEPDAMPAKPARKTTPVARANAARPPWPSLRNRRASTKVAAISARNPMAPETMWRIPWTVGATGAPSGVPTGKPRIGSAVKTPAATRLMPYTASSRGTD